VGVQVDQARYQRVVRQLDAAGGGEGAPGLLRGEQGDDASPGDRYAVIGENRARRLDRNDPARADEEVDLFYRAKPLSEMIARRLGARQAISSLRFLVSGQNFAGTVLPMPMVSTLSRSTPFPTR
jgi:hypothetical protein